MTATANRMTDQQRRAIATRDVSISLSAGAGCGKTFVLTERFLAHLDPRQFGTDLNHLVAITYTDAAAREMRDRIRLKCHARLMSTRGDEADAWYRLLRSLDEARISTIHSFCGNLVRQHAVEMGLDPRFGILMPAQVDVLKAETIDALLRARLGGDLRADAIELVTHLGLNKVLAALPDWMGGLSRKSAESWTAKSDDDILTAWSRGFSTTVTEPLADALTASGSIPALLALLPHAVCEDPKFSDRRDAIVELLTSLRSTRIESNGIARLYEVATLNGVARKELWPDIESRNTIRDHLKEVRQIFQAELGTDFHRLKYDASHARKAARLGQLMLRLARDANTALDRQKRQLNVLDFDDLIDLAIRLMDHVPAARHRVLNDIQMLLVDEFQDTSPLQADFIRTLCGQDWRSGRLFFVGDFKQSIYGFLGAEPEVFRQTRDETPASGQLSLSVNFRSQPGILDFVNHLFADAIDDYEPLVPHRSSVSSEPCVEFLWTKTGEGVSKGQTKESRQLEAMAIGKRLREIVDSEDRLIAAGSEDGPSKPRAVRPQDIVLLFRAMTDTDYYEAALVEHGFDCYVEGGHAFYAQQEIHDVLNLLRCVASGADEIALIGALRSPFFSLADETIFWLAHRGRQVDRQSPVSCGLFGPGRWRELSAAEQAKVTRAAQTIAELRRLKDRLSVAALIGTAIERTGYDAALLAEFMGPRKLANLEKLVQQAQAADASELSGLSRFILELSRFTSRHPKEPPASTVAQDANVIRLMTIHQAKGLEFPVIVVPDLARSSRADSDTILLDERLGPLCRPRVRESGGRLMTGLDLHRVRTRREDRNESVRLLYVACTRAADHLILSSSIKDFEKVSGSWLKSLETRFELESGDPRGALRGDEGVPEVRTTVIDSEAESAPRRRRRTVDLSRVADAAQQRAGGLPAGMPPAIAPFAPPPPKRPLFSFSRLSGTLRRQHFAPTLDDPVSASLAAENAADLEAEDAGTSDGDPRGVGLLVHSILEVWDFRAAPRPPDEDDVRRVARRQAAFCLADFPRPEIETMVAEAVPIVVRFLQTDRAAQIGQASELHREIEFMLPTPAVDRTAGETWLTGIIDCAYRDARGAWHVVDYKTRPVAAGDEPAAAAEYEMQLFVYTTALATRLAIEPPAAVVPFVRTGREHRFAWNEADRARLLLELNRVVREIRS